MQLQIAKNGGSRRRRDRPVVGDLTDTENGDNGNAFSDLVLGFIIFL